MGCGIPGKLIINRDLKTGKGGGVDIRTDSTYEISDYVRFDFYQLS